jgi:hypothetical protein
MFECRICSPLSDEHAIRLALEKKLPLMQWDEGDSSWDKVRVSGNNAQASITVYRYESPGPFQLTIVLEKGTVANLEQTYHELRGQVLEALHGSLQQRLTPQPVTLIKSQGRFPLAYRFECDRSLAEIKRTLDDAEFWFWETVRCQTHGLCVEGRIPFRRAGKDIFNAKDKIRIIGEKPSFVIEVGHCEDQVDRTPKCDQIHETVQNTILPGIGAHHVQSAD